MTRLVVVGGIAVAIAIAILVDLEPDSSNVAVEHPTPRATVDSERARPERVARPLAGSQDRVRAFESARRNQRLRREREVAPIQQQLATLLARVTEEKDFSARQRLVAEYTLAANALPELYRIEALDRLPRPKRGPGRTGP